MRATVLHSSATPNTTDLPPTPHSTAWWQKGRSESRRPRQCDGAGGGVERGAPGERAHWAWRRVVARRVLRPGNGPAHHAEPFGTPSPAAFKRGAAFFPQVFEKTARSGGRERCRKLPAQCFPLMPAPISLASLGQARQVTRGLDEDQRDLEYPGRGQCGCSAANLLPCGCCVFARYIMSR